jgi:hypothetical protein
VYYPTSPKRGMSDAVTVPAGKDHYPLSPFPHRKSSGLGKLSRLHYTPPSPSDLSSLTSLSETTPRNSPSPSPPPSPSDSSSSASETPSATVRKRNRIMSTNKGMAYVEQSAPSKPPILYPGDVSPEILLEFEIGCIGYFDTKEIAPDRQVRKIIAGLKDSRMRDWITTDHERILELSFEEFFVELRSLFLDPNWEELTCREMGTMVQKGEAFWNYAIRMQAKNSLLLNTPSHLSDDQLRHHLEAGMDETLARRYICSEATKVLDLREWLHNVKKVDDQMRAERMEFEQIAKAQREHARRTYNAPEPTSRPTNNNNRGPRPDGAVTRLPKLTQRERQLLFDNEGCLKCRTPFAGHRSSNCPNNFPSATNYRSLTQADVDKAKKTLRSVAVVGNASEETSPHPVAAVLGLSEAPVAYLPNNSSSVIENGTDSELV